MSHHLIRITNIHWPYFMPDTVLNTLRSVNPFSTHRNPNYDHHCFIDKEPERWVNIPMWKSWDLNPDNQSPRPVSLNCHAMPPPDMCDVFSALPCALRQVWMPPFYWWGIQVLEFSYVINISTRRWGQDIYVWIFLI